MRSSKCASYWESAECRELHDIVVPEVVSFKPQTTAWYVLFLAIFVLCAWGLVVWRRGVIRNRYRKLALARLRDIESRAAFTELPALVKQTALAFTPREDVASLSGDAWLRFLDTSYGGRGFTEGPGRLLLELAYGRAENVDTDTLMMLVSQWIREHHVRV